MPEEESIVVESVLLAVTRVSTLLGDKRRSSGRSRDDTTVGSWRITMAVAWYPCRSNGYEQPGRRARRETKLELRLVR